MNNYTRLYDDNEVETPEAREFCNKVTKALHPIIKEYIDAGYDTRDMTTCALGTVDYLMVCGRMVRQMHKRKAAKEN